MSTTYDQSQPTPLPWKIDFPIISGKYPTLDDGTPYIEIKAGCGYAGGVEPGFQFPAFIQPADAALIAAAPELLAALEMLMAQRPTNFADTPSEAYDLAMWQHAEAAIAKARNFPTRPAVDDGEPQSHGTQKPEPGGNLLKPYQVGETINGQFGFKTPTGRSDGFLTREDAERAAFETENQDRAEAIAAIGPISEVLRKHFAAEDGKAGAL